MKLLSATTLVLLVALFTMTATATDPDRPLTQPTGGGTSWEVLNSGTTNGLAAVHFVDQNTGYAVGIVGMILRTNDGGITWTLLPSGTNENLNGIWFVNAQKGFVVGDNGTALVTADAGSTWHPVATGTKHNLRAVAFTQAGYGAMVGDSATLITSKDFGSKWNMKAAGVSERLNAIAFGDNENGFIVGEHGVLLRMVNGVDAWPQLMLDVPLTNGKLMCASMPEPNTIVVAGEAGLIFRSTDGGKKWLRLNSGMNKTIYGMCFTDLRTGTVVGEDGNVYRTTSTGWTWQKQTTNTSARLTSVCYCSTETGFIVGGGGLILRSPGATTAIDNRLVETPTSLNLFQNAPNPFNPSTTIRYSLDQAAPVKLTIYNCLGQPVATLVDGVSTPGDHLVNFNASGLESGVYIAELRSGATAKVMRMVLNK